MSELTDLVRIYQNDPQEFQRILLANPKLGLQLQALYREMEAKDQVSVDGFRRAYEAFYGRPMPKVVEQPTEAFVWAFHERKGVVLEGWRGFGKSTFFAAWSPYVMGINPVGSTALVRVNDQKAKEMGKTVADLIMTNPGWQKLFPHVVPDEKAGWSVENGFNVMNTRITGQPGSPGFEEKYAKWRMMCFADHLSEKSLICAGVESGSIIGLHPSNGMWFDDLHDEANTRSQAEMKKITDILEGNIIPTWFSAGGAPTLGVFCTPWSVNPPDAYQVMLKTGLFKHVKIPIFVEDPNGEEIPDHTTSGEPVASDWVGKKVRPAWPEVFPVTRIADMIKAMGTRFGQMALLDVSLSKPQNMKYQQFPSKDIKWAEWPMTLGVDPVGWVKGISTGEGISHFAAVQLLRTPYNTVVIGDGFVEKIDALEGEKRVADVQRTFNKTYQNASIEINGAGATWAAMITRGSGIKYHGHTVNELGKGNKKDRQYRFLQPLLAAGALLVSDADTPFLNAVREYLDSFPNFDNDSHLLDVGDAICIGVLDIPEVWTKIVVHDGHADRDDIWAAKRRMVVDPWARLLDGRR